MDAVPGCRPGAVRSGNPFGPRRSCRRRVGRRARRRRCGRPASSRSARVPDCRQPNSRPQFGNGTPSTSAASSFVLPASTATGPWPGLSTALRPRRRLGSRRPDEEIKTAASAAAAAGAGEGAGEPRPASLRGRRGAGRRRRCAARRPGARPQVEPAERRRHPSAGARGRPAGRGMSDPVLHLFTRSLPGASRRRAAPADGSSARRARDVRSRAHASSVTDAGAAEIFPIGPPE